MKQNANIEPQAAGFPFNYLSKQNQINALNSGTSVQIDAKTDIQYIVGMKYIDGLDFNATAECFICTGVGASREELAAALRECALTEVNVIDLPDDFDHRIRLVDALLIIDLLENTALPTTITIFSILGEVLFERSIDEHHISINLSNYLTGVYFISINNEKTYKFL